MKPISKNSSTTSTAPKKPSRRPRWFGPLPENPIYRRMHKALIWEIAPVTVLDWIEAEEYVLSQYQSMCFENWHNVIFEHSRWEGTKRAVKRRLRQRCRSDPEDELDWKAGVFGPKWLPRLNQLKLRLRPSWLDNQIWTASLEGAPPRFGAETQPYGI